jgi:hypothetical protein
MASKWKTNGCLTGHGAGQPESPWRIPLVRAVWHMRNLPAAEPDKAYQLLIM